MFETSMQEKLKKIFKVKKVTFDEPGPDPEQDCMFVEVENARTKISEGKARARVNGQVTLFAPNKQLPFGFFSKAIDLAESTDKKDFFFFDFEENTKVFRDIVQRSFRFVYFYSGQYDPEQGSIDSVNLSIEVKE